MYPASSYCLRYFIQHFIAIFIHFCAVNKFNQLLGDSVIEVKLRQARLVLGWVTARKD